MPSLFLYLLMIDQETIGSWSLISIKVSIKKLGEIINVPVSVKMSVLNVLNAINFIKVINVPAITD